jgi:hypothetical protein
VFGKSEQQVKFLDTQVDASRVDAPFSSAGVDRQIAKPDRCRVIRLTFETLQNGFDAGHQLARVERLGQMIICTEFETHNLVDMLIPGSEHRDSGGVIPGSQTATHFQSVQLQHYLTQHHEGRTVTHRLPIADRRFPTCSMGAK